LLDISRGAIAMKKLGVLKPYLFHVPYWFTHNPYSSTVTKMFGKYLNMFKFNLFTLTTRLATRSGVPTDHSVYPG
jgi:hypothetical protein